MKRSVLLLGSLAFLIGCASAPTTQTAPTPSPKPVAASLDKPTYPVQRGTVVDQLQLSGRVGAVQQQDLSFTQDGHIKTLYVTRTSAITEGQLLSLPVLAVGVGLLWLSRRSPVANAPVALAPATNP